MRRGGLIVGALCLPLLQSCAALHVTAPQSPALKALERRVGTIAYMGVDGNVHTMDQAGGSRRDVTADAVLPEDSSAASRFYQYPVWSPDGSILAYVGVQRTADSSPDHYSVWTSTLKDARAVQVFRSDVRVPRLISWAPDSSRLVFVTAADMPGEELDSVPPRGGEVARLGEGLAFAWRWQRSASSLAVHAGSGVAGTPRERVDVLNATSGEIERDIVLTPGAFEAPAWLRDGHDIIVVARNDTTSLLYRADLSGQRGRTLLSVPGSTTMDISPDGRHLAYDSETFVGTEAGSHLSVLDLAGTSRGGGTLPKPRVLSGGDFVVAFFWSPNGDSIAYLAPSTSPSASATDGFSFLLKVVRVGTGALRTVATFRPSPFFIGLVREFGQYAQSVRLWSPDSRFLVYSEVDSTGPGIMVAYADEAIAPRRIADGLMATWSPQ